MRILQVHNHYQQYGGEDAVVKAEAELLKNHGEEVFQYTRSNAEIQNRNAFVQFEKFARLNFSSQSYREIKKLIKKVKPDLCHVYNTFFMITPAVYQACAEEQIPIVQSLYNYRLMCANALFLRDGKPCEECLEHTRMRGVRYGCYKNSRVMSSVIVHMQNQQWKKATWTKKVHAFITATEFTKKKHVQAGIPSERIFVKPHFMDIASPRRNSDGGYALYIGRMSEEKGIRILLKAWEGVQKVPLKMIGQGPLLDEIREIISRNNLNVNALGYCSEEDYLRSLKNATFVVVPSICHDNFPRTIVEAYAHGVPVLGSRIEGIKEYIKEGHTGYLFEPGNPDDLVKAVDLIKPADLNKFSESCRLEYEKNYTAEINYGLLKNIYKNLLT